MFKAMLVNLISKYQKYIRGMLPACCRFSPSCSEYAKEALTKYGVVKGGLKALKRLFECQPFSGKSGYYPLR
jgi:hypothetical protein